MSGERTVKRVFAWAIGVPIGLLAIALSVANRAPVTFSLDPLSAEQPAISFELPLFVLLFGAAFLGLLIGWLVGWSGQSALRRELRERRRQPRGEPPNLPHSAGRAMVSRP